MKRKMLAAMMLILILPILLFATVFCNGQNKTSEQKEELSRDEQEAADDNSLDERVEELIYDRRAQGKVAVKIRGGIAEEEAYRIFAAHGFERQSVEKQYMPQVYVLRFSEDERDIRSVIREFLLDSNVEYAETIALGSALLDEQIEDMVSTERAPGEVVVRLQDGISEEEAYLIFASHGFERQSVQKQYTPQMYVLHFSEDERDIRSIIKELLLDGSFLYVYPSVVGELCFILLDGDGKHLNDVVSMVQAYIHGSYRHLNKRHIIRLLAYSLMRAARTTFPNDGSQESFS
jgi:hypothetical protein